MSKPLIGVIAGLVFVIIVLVFLLGRHSSTSIVVGGNPNGSQQSSQPTGLVGNWESGINTTEPSGVGYEFKADGTGHSYSYIASPHSESLNSTFRWATDVGNLELTNVQDVPPIAGFVPPPIEYTYNISPDGSTLTVGLGAKPGDVLYGIPPLIYARK